MTTLPDQQRASDGSVRFAWARDENKRIVHVTEVSSGLACNCWCVECERQLIARKGLKVASHFAHRNFSSCLPERAFHRAAKEILADVAKAGADFLLPSGDVTPLTHATLEHKIAGGPYLDAWIQTSAGAYGVEIDVAHVKSRDHTETIRALDINAIEIQLGFYSPRMDRDSLRDALVSSAQRIWLRPRPALPGRDHAAGASRPAAPSTTLEACYEALKDRLENARLPCPTFAARAAKWTAQLDMNDGMRAAARKTLLLKSVGEMELVSIGVGNTAIRCAGEAGDGRRLASIDVVLFTRDSSSVILQPRKPTLLIRCPLNPSEPWLDAMDGHWRGIDRWVDELDRRFAAAKI